MDQLLAMEGLESYRNRGPKSESLTAVSVNQCTGGSLPQAPSLPRATSGMARFLLRFVSEMLR